AVDLVLVAEHTVDFGHRGELHGVRLRGAAGDDDLSAGLLAPEPPDRLPRLAYRLASDCAGVDDHRVGDTGSLGLAPHCFRFDDVEPAAEGDDVEGHLRAPCPGRSAARSGALQTRDRINVWRCRICGA